MVSSRIANGDRVTMTLIQALQGLRRTFEGVDPSAQPARISANVRRGSIRVSFSKHPDQPSTQGQDENDPPELQKANGCGFADSHHEWKESDQKYDERNEKNEL